MLFELTNSVPGPMMEPCQNVRSWSQVQIQPPKAVFTAKCTLSMNLLLQLPLDDCAMVTAHLKVCQLFNTAFSSLGLSLILTSNTPAEASPH